MATQVLLKNVPAEVEIYRAGGAQTIEHPIPHPTWSWSYRREAQHFIERLRSGKPFLSSGQDTRTDVQLIEDVYRAHLVRQGVL
ncbi:MAG: hypothetical protein U9R79_05255 [Armatimonadota bacterium]|nr:hypothetical protein [Chloroflexota bacterium]MEA3400636.1 hypothetical protein [Armatimonadota bacterium]